MDNDQVCCICVECADSNWKPVCTSCIEYIRGLKARVAELEGIRPHSTGSEVDFGRLQSFVRMRNYSYACEWDMRLGEAMLNTLQARIDAAVERLKHTCNRTDADQVLKILTGDEDGKESGK